MIESSTPRAASPPEPFTRLTRPLPWLVFVLVSLGLVATLTWIYTQQTRELKLAAQANLSAIADLEARQVKTWLDERLRDARLVSFDGFAEEWADWLEKGGDEARLGPLRRRLEALRVAGDYRAISILDTDGQPRLSVGNSAPMTPSEQAIALHALEQDSPQISGFYSDLRLGLHLGIVAPLFDERKPVGLLRLEIDPQTGLFPLLSIWPTPSPSAETLLLRGLPDERIQFLSPRRHDPAAPLSTDLPLLSKPVLAEMIRSGQDGFLEGRDYRNRPSLAALRHIPDTDWVLIAKIDRAEVLAPISERLMTLAGFGLALLLGAALVVTLLSWRRRAQYERDRYRLLLEHRQAQESARQALAEGEQRLQMVLRGAKIGFWDWNIRTGQSFYSPEWHNLVGYRPGEIDNHHDTWRSLIHPDDLPTVDATLDAHLHGDTPTYEIEFRILNASGEWRWVLSRGQVVEYDSEGQPQRMIGTHLDIHDKKQGEMKMRLWTQALEQSPFGIIVTDENVRILAANRAFGQITGYESGQAIGHTPALLKSGRQDEGFYQRMWETIRNTGHWEGEIWNRRHNGEIYPEWLSIAAIRDSQGRVVNYLGIFTDLTENKAALERIEYLASHDALSGLPNAPTFLQELTLLLRALPRPGQHCALLLLDLDRFRNINDSMGHATGDYLLTVIADRLVNTLPPGTLIGRRGGDEFLVGLGALDQAEEASDYARRLIRSIAEPIWVEEAGLNISVGCSIGISLYPDDTDDAESLVRHADTAMYRAKSMGRNTFQFFAEDNAEKALENVFLEAELRAAMKTHALTLAYQPKVDLASGRLVGVEALVRWNHPEHGLISPARFIPVAEASGLIVPLGELILEEACAQLRHWRDMDLPPFPVAVNVSAVQFRQGEFVEMLTRTVEKYRLQPSDLEIELTESVLMQDATGTIDLLNQLRTLGYRLALDDFGTGYSSLSYLRCLPVQTLKLDQSFIRAMEDNSANRAIVESAIHMGHALDLCVIAEGVETASDARHLQGIACDQAQGYHFARPLPPQELETWLRARSSSEGSPK